MWKCLLTLLSSCWALLLQFFFFRITQVRHSLYSRDYVEPTFRKEDLSEPLAEDDVRRYRPIKAATNEETSSLNYDPLVAWVINCNKKNFLIYLLIFSSAWEWSVAISFHCWYKVLIVPTMQFECTLLWILNGLDLMCNDTCIGE